LWAIFDTSFYTFKRMIICTLYLLQNIHLNVIL
jgi:hypothetical protein